MDRQLGPKSRQTATYLLFALAVLLLAACSDFSGGEVDRRQAPPAANQVSDEGTDAAVTGSDEIDVDDDEVVQGAGDAGEDPLAASLDRLKRGEIDPVRMEAGLDWAQGFFTYYAPLDSIQALGIDNLIYRALEVHRRLDTGEFTEETMSQNARNLLAISDGIQYSSDRPLTEQVGQTAEIREAILARVVEGQTDLSPLEALASDKIAGVFAPPAVEAIGGKYLVFTQETPESEFAFLGVILAVDVAGAGGHSLTYSDQGWDTLNWLGDATGPFWGRLPIGNSGDPANTAEARPGVLLLSEGVYKEIVGGD